MFAVIFVLAAFTLLATIKHSAPRRDPRDRWHTRNPS